MDYIRFSEDMEFAIQDGASLDRIILITDSEAEAMTICNVVRDDSNLRHVEFWNEGAEQPYGVYEDLTINAPSTRYDEDDHIVVTISLREKTRLELRVDALEESQAVQDGAIEDLGLVVSDLVEG